MTASPSRTGIVGIDVGATLDGFVGDAARTFPVGKVGAEAARLMSSGDMAATGRPISAVLG